MNELAQRAKDSASRAHTGLGVLTVMLASFGVITWRQFWLIFGMTFAVGVIEALVTAWWRSPRG